MIPLQSPPTNMGGTNLNPELGTGDWVKRGRSGSSTSTSS